MRAPAVRWTAAALLCVAMQVGLTVGLDEQSWTMRAGLAALAALCAAKTVCSRPRLGDATPAWRWHIATSAFVVWSVSWAAAAIALPSDWAPPFLGQIGLLRQILFLVVLLPTSEQDQGWRFRCLDAAQVTVMGATLAILSAPGAALLHIEQPGYPYLYVGHIALAIVSIASYLKQQGGIRRLLGPMMVVHSIYAVTSLLAGVVHAMWAVPDLSLIWVFGNAAFVAYLIIPADRFGRSVELGVSARHVSSHLPSLLLTAVILMLSTELGRRSLPWGAGVGIASLLIYAARTTLLNDHHLTSRDLLIAREEARGRALIDIVHEIRSPLGSVVLNAGMLRRDDGMSPRTRRWAEQIHAGSTHVTDLLKDILDLERLDAGLVEVNVEECDPDRIMADVLTIAAAQAKEYGVLLVIPMGPPSPRIMADPAKLGRVLVNLVTNAIRFTPGGGRVEIALCSVDRRRVAIMVKDTGIGMTAEQLGNLFERFGHSSNPVNGRAGSGLGLSICRGLTFAMGGELSIASVLGAGTTATITLPGVP